MPKARSALLARCKRQSLVQASYNRRMTVPDGVFLGIDLGGTKIRSMSFNRDMQVVAEDYRETEAFLGRDAVIARMADSARAAAKGSPIIAAGISAPGPLRPKDGIVTEPPNLPGWRDVPLAQLLSDRLGAPAWIENDANAAALAESRMGAGVGLQHMILMTLGTGIGGGLILDGKLYDGATGGAGEIGHMIVLPDGPICGCGRHGCLEAMASGVAFAREAASLVERFPDGILAKIVREANEEPDAKLLQQAAEAGDIQAEEVIRIAGRYLGAGMTNLVNVFNPEMIVIGGSLRLMGEPYLGEAYHVLERDAFSQHFSDLRIAEAKLSDEAPAIGAAYLARAHLEQATAS